MLSSTSRNCFEVDTSLVTLRFHITTNYNRKRLANSFTSFTVHKSSLGFLVRARKLNTTETHIAYFVQRSFSKVEIVMGNRQQASTIYKPHKRSGSSFLFNERLTNDAPDCTCVFAFSCSHLRYTHVYSFLLHFVLAFVPPDTGRLRILFLHRLHSHSFYSISHSFLRRDCFILFSFSGKKESHKRWMLPGREKKGRSAILKSA